VDCELESGSFVPFTLVDGGSKHTRHAKESAEVTYQSNMGQVHARLSPYKPSLQGLQISLASRQVAQAFSVSAPDRDLFPVTEPPAPRRCPSTNKLAGDRASNDILQANNMKLPFKGLSTGLVLFVLAAGFTSLGFLSFINRQPESATPDFISETTYSIIGGSISIFVGGTFLAAAILSAGTLLRRRRLLTPEGRNDGAYTTD